MTTPITRLRMTDVTDKQWRLIEASMHSYALRGRAVSVDLRSVVNALLYRTYLHCSWRELPPEFPPWQTVYDYFRRWQKDGTWQKILTVIQNS